MQSWATRLIFWCVNDQQACSVAFLTKQKFVLLCECKIQHSYKQRSYWFMRYFLVVCLYSACGNCWQFLSLCKLGCGQDLLSLCGLTTLCSYIISSKNWNCHLKLDHCMWFCRRNWSLCSTHYFSECTATKLLTLSASSQDFLANDWSETWKTDKGFRISRLQDFSISQGKYFSM